MSINIADTFKPASGDNTFPVVADINVKNGYRVVADHASRNAIDSRLLTTGALVGVVDSDGSGNYAEYRFLGGSPATDADWVLVNTSNEIVWRPDGTGTAVTWADVMTKVTVNRGPSIIVCDRPSGSLTIPAGTYNLNGSGFFSNVANVFVSADDGVTLQNLTYVDGLTLTSNNSAADFLAYTTVEPAIRFSNFAEIDNEGSVPWLAAYAGNFLLQLDNAADTASSWFIDLNSGNLTIKVLNAGPGPGYTNTLVTGTGSVSLLHDGSGFNTALIVTSFPGLVGAYTNNPISLVGGAGPTSFRPSIGAGNQGTTYYDTDTDQYLVWNGAAWKIVSSALIVWRAGGGGTATTWAEVMNQVAANTGPSIIYADEGSYTIPAGTYEMKLSTIISPTPSEASPSFSVSCDDGVIFNNLGEICGFFFSGNNSAGPLFTYDGESILTVSGYAILDNTGASVAAIQAANGTNPTIYLKNGGVTKGPIVEMLGAGTLSIVISEPVFEGKCPISDDSVIGAVPAMLIFIHDGVQMPDLSGFTGTFENSPRNMTGGNGPTAKRPVAVVKGTTYYDTDTDQYLVWNGASWTVIV